MAIVVTLAEVQQWLESTKMTLAAVNPELAETARQVVFSDLASAYDTSGWVSPSSTPKLVRVVVSSLVAAWEYQRAYAEEGDTTYGDKLEARAFLLLEGIASGTTILEELPGVGQQSQIPDFFPNDLSAALGVYDGLGYQVGLEGADDIKFRMSSKY